MWWYDLGLWARMSVAGLAVAAALVLALGWYIPKWVGERFLTTQAEADQTVLTALTETEALVVDGAGSDFDALDAFVDTALLRGDFVRVKLWAPDGTILYSDLDQLVGRRFVPDEDFASLFEPTSHVSDLTAEENELERDEFAADLLETYVPVRSADGELLAVWEVYHDLQDHDSAVAATERTVRVAVGGGLALLALFLVSVFGGLVASVHRRRREAEQRSADLATLSRIAQSSAGSLDREHLVGATLSHLDQSGTFDWVEASHVASDGAVAELATTRQMSASTPDVEEPLTASTEIASGSLRLRGRPATDADRDSGAALLGAAVEELGVAVNRAELYDDLERSRARLRVVMQQLVSAQDLERQRIVGDIHDGLGQDLHRVLFGIRGRLAADPAEIDEELHKLEAVISGSSAKLRRLLQELHPSTINDIGLAASIRSLVERLRSEYGLKVELRQDDFTEPPEPVRIAVFRIAQEALTNVAKHSGTLVARVSLTIDGACITSTVSDDGPGLSVDRADGLGMWLMRERAEAAGGSLVVTSDDRGVTIMARIPMTGAP